MARLIDIYNNPNADFTDEEWEHIKTLRVMHKKLGSGGNQDRRKALEWVFELLMEISEE